MQFTVKVRVLNSVGRFLFAVGPDQARRYLATKVVRVRTKRRGMVIEVETPPSSEPELGDPRGTAIGGKRFIQQVRHLGMPIFRHKDEDILDYQADFLNVMETAGAVLVAQDALAIDKAICCRDRLRDRRPPLG